MSYDVVGTGRQTWGMCARRKRRKPECLTSSGARVLVQLFTTRCRMGLRDRGGHDTLDPLACKGLIVLATLVPSTVARSMSCLIELVSSVGAVDTLGTEGDGLLDLSIQRTRRRVRRVSMGLSTQSLTSLR